MVTYLMGFLPAGLVSVDTAVKADMLLDWSINNVLAKLRANLILWGAGLMMIVGVVMIIFGIFKIAQGMISHGKTQVNWVVNILLIVVGALFCAGSTFFNSLTKNNGGVGAAIANELNALGR